MYRILALLLLSLNFIYIASANTEGNGQTASSGPDYWIGRWYKFKKAAFTVSFDDNYRFQVVYATPLLNQHNYKATYFIVTNRVGKGWAPGWDTLNMLASQGHEIASHSKNHADFTYLSQHPEFADSMRREFRDSRDTINARIPSQQCETFAWPFGSVNIVSTEISANYYMACRGSIDRFEDSVPDNYYNIYSQHIYHDTPLESVNGYIDTILKYDGWLVERWHGFRVMHDTNGYEPVYIGDFREHLNYIAQNENNLWITTLGKVVKYMRERDVSSLWFVDSTGYKVQFNLSNNLPDTLFHYNVPLSIRVKAHGKIENVYMITQGNDTLSFGFTWYYGTKYIYFDAVPNKGFIVLHLPDPAGMHDLLALKRGAANYPNPFNSSTTILFDVPQAEYVDVRVYDQTGRQLRDFSNLYPAGRNSIEFDGTALSPGVYNCVIRTRERKTDVRMVLTH
ncbi:MAG: polysaccharide deacetylase family protein [Bacteroidetes bacterium]|nr:polysaccharide deacetylase family protein [Bacteroidota bacterium]